MKQNILYKSASQRCLQVQPVKNDLSSFGAVTEKIPGEVLQVYFLILPVLLAWTLATGQALHSGFHFWRHVS